MCYQLFLQLTFFLLDLLCAIFTPSTSTALEMTDSVEKSPVWLKQLEMVVLEISFQAAADQRMAVSWSTL